MSNNVQQGELNALMCMSGRAEEGAAAGRRAEETSAIRLLRRPGGPLLFSLIVRSKEGWPGLISLLADSVPHTDLESNANRETDLNLKHSEKSLNSFCECKGLEKFWT